jgi:hypothetical protein
MGWFMGDYPFKKKTSLDVWWAKQPPDLSNRLMCFAKNSHTRASSCCFAGTQGAASGTQRHPCCFKEHGKPACFFSLNCGHPNSWMVYKGKSH